MKAFIIGTLGTFAFVYLFVAWVLFDQAWITHVGEWSPEARFAIMAIYVVFGFLICISIQSYFDFIDDGG